MPDIPDFKSLSQDLVTKAVDLVPTPRGVCPPGMSREPKWDFTSDDCIALDPKYHDPPLVP